jgi:hypothetical protein
LLYTLSFAFFKKRKKKKKVEGGKKEKIAKEKRKGKNSQRLFPMQICLGGHAMRDFPSC